MKLNITVKTLDSQNYQFEAENDWTILRFKQHIQDTVNVNSSEQRLIFCGRVLQNEKKLTDYDCNGKVIHLVRRPPPVVSDEDNNNNTSSRNQNDQSQNNNNRRTMLIDNGGNNGASMNDVFPARIDGNVRFYDDNNILISATALGGIDMGNLMRNVFTLQHALDMSRHFPAATGVPATHAPRYEGTSFVWGSPMDTTTTTTPSIQTSRYQASATAQAHIDMDRRLNNAYRLLTITATLMYECRNRLPRSARTALTRRRSSDNNNSNNNNNNTGEPEASQNDPHMDDEDEGAEGERVADEISEPDDVDLNDMVQDDSSASASASAARTVDDLPQSDVAELGEAHRQRSSDSILPPARLSTDALSASTTLRRSADDLSIGVRTQGMPAPDDRSATGRQRQPSHTTDELPNSIGRREGDGSVLGEEQRQSNERILLDRYLSIVSASLELQDQYQALLGRHRRLMGMSRRGRFGAYQNPPIAPTNNSNDNNNAISSADRRGSTDSSSIRDSTETESQSSSASSSSLMAEARILGPYIPRITHHMSHLQHALSDFSYDFIRGRLRLASNPRGFSRPQFARRSVPTGSTPVATRPTDQQQQEPLAQQRQHQEQQSQAPRAQAETHSPPLRRSQSQEGINRPQQQANIPLTSQASFTTTIIRPRMPPGFVITSEPGQTNIQIPISINPMEFLPPVWLGSDQNARDNNNLSPTSNNGDQTNNARSQSSPSLNQQSETGNDNSTSMHQATPRAQGPEQRQQARNTTSQQQSNVPNMIGIATPRLALPFDPYLTCLSPWAHWITSSSARAGRPANVTSQANVGPVPVPRPIITLPPFQFVHPAPAPATGPRPQQNQRPVQQQPAVTRANVSQTTASAQPNAQNQSFEAGLTEVVNNILGSLFRPPNQDQSQQPQQQTQSQSQSQQQSPGSGQQAARDPIVDILPGLAINAASQILGNVFGIGPLTPESRNTSTSATASPGQRPTQHTRPLIQTRTVMMDIDIDEGPPMASNDNQNNNNARHSASGGRQTSSDAAQQASVRETYQQPYSNRPSTSSNLRCDRNQLASVMRNHPDWIPIIEADIRAMERESNINNNTIQSFSDAYLSSLPRKRRRLLTATPDRVPILQPSSSQALTNLLRRAIISTDSMSHDSRDIEEILSLITNDPDLQEAYDEYIKCAVEARLQSDCNYRPEKFEKSSKYFKK